MELFFDVESMSVGTPVFPKFPSIFDIGFDMNSLDVVLCSSEIMCIVAFYEAVKFPA